MFNYWSDITKKDRVSQESFDQKYLDNIDFLIRKIYSKDSAPLEDMSNIALAAFPITNGYKIFKDASVFKTPRDSYFIEGILKADISIKLVSGIEQVGLWDYIFCKNKSLKRAERTIDYYHKDGPVIGAFLDTKKLYVIERLL